MVDIIYYSESIPECQVRFGRYASLNPVLWTTFVVGSYVNLNPVFLFLRTKSIVGCYTNSKKAALGGAVVPMPCKVQSFLGFRNDVVSIPCWFESSLEGKAHGWSKSDLRDRAHCWSQVCRRCNAIIMLA